MSIAVLGPAQSDIQWVPVKLATHLRLVPMVRMVELYLHSPIRLHRVVLN
jgi:hypothetical protein